MQAIVIEPGTIVLTKDKAVAALQRYLAAETGEELAAAMDAMEDTAAADPHDAAAVVQAVAILLTPQPKKPAPFRMGANLSIGADSDEPLMAGLRDLLNASGPEAGQAAGERLRALAADNPQQAFTLHMLIGSILLPEGHA